MVLGVLPSIKQRVCSRLRALRKRFLYWTQPSTTSLVVGTLVN